MTTTTDHPPTTAGAVIGYRRDGRPIRLMAGGDETHLATADEIRNQEGTPAGRLADARDAHSDRFRAMTAIMDGAAARGGDGALLASERREYDAHLDEMRRLDNLVLRLTAEVGTRSVDRSELVGVDGGATRSSAAPVGRRDDALRPEQRMTDYANVRGLVRDEERELSIGRYFRGMVTGNWDDADTERRALVEGTQSAGGFLVPTPLSAQVIDRARNQARIFQAGAVTVPMTSSTLKLARVASDPTANWHTEEAVISPSDATFEQVTLTARTLTALVKMSRELLEDADNIDGLVTSIIGQQFGLKLDLAAMYGTGVAPEPQGVKTATGVTTISKGANGGQISYDDLIDAVGTLEDNNFRAGASIYAPRTGRSLAKLRDSQNNYLRPPAYLDDVRRLSTNQVPTNLTQGTANNASDMFTADWSNLAVGVRHQFSVQVLTERYADQGDVGLVCWFRGDVALLRPKAFVVTTGVTP